MNKTRIGVAICYKNNRICTMHCTYTSLTTNLNICL